MFKTLLILILLALLIEISVMNHNIILLKIQCEKILNYMDEVDQSMIPNDPEQKYTF